MSILPIPTSPVLTDTLTETKQMTPPLPQDSGAGPVFAQTVPVSAEKTETYIETSEKNNHLKRENWTELSLRFLMS